MDPRALLVGYIRPGSILRIRVDLNLKGFFTLAIDVPNPPKNFLKKIYSNSTSNISVVGLQKHPAHGWWRMEDLDPVFNNISFDDSISLNKLAILVKAKLVRWSKNEYFLI